MFSYEHLNSFCATYDEQSYSKAARAIGKDRTTIREQVKALEDSYRTILFTIEGKRRYLPALHVLFISNQNYWCKTVSDCI